MVRAETLARAKRGLVLVNTSRGGLIDAEAAIEALKTGQLGGLAIDVYEQEADLFFEDLSNEILSDDVLRPAADLPQRPRHRPPGLLHTGGVGGDCRDHAGQCDPLRCRRAARRGASDRRDGGAATPRCIGLTSGLRSAGTLRHVVWWTGGCMHSRRNWGTFFLSPKLESPGTHKAILTGRPW